MTRDQLQSLKHRVQGSQSPLSDAYDLIGAVEAMMDRVESLFDAIKHGDADHQAWLKAKIVEHFKDD